MSSQQFVSKLVSKAFWRGLLVPKHLLRSRVGMGEPPQRCWEGRWVVASRFPKNRLSSVVNKGKIQQLKFGWQYQVFADSLDADSLWNGIFKRKSRNSFMCRVQLMLRKIHIAEMLFRRAGARAARCCWGGCKQGRVISGVVALAQARSGALPGMSTRGGSGTCYGRLLGSHSCWASYSMTWDACSCTGCPCGAQASWCVSGVTTCQATIQLCRIFKSLLVTASTEQASCSCLNCLPLLYAVESLVAGELHRAPATH